MFRFIINFSRSRVEGNLSSVVLYSEIPFSELLRTGRRQVGCIQDTIYAHSQYDANESHGPCRADPRVHFRDSSISRRRASCIDKSECIKHCPSPICTRQSISGRCYCYSRKIHKSFAWRRRPCLRSAFAAANDGVESTPCQSKLGGRRTFSTFSVSCRATI